MPILVSLSTSTVAPYPTVAPGGIFFTSRRRALNSMAGFREISLGGTLVGDNP
ncbi:unannotated protein [freshwater metagenome]|uniref:Unannotated protein n=1 Tax=freshwater metagenome TaxID=449393 RepID=A0A6J6P4F4_9ZZZZ